MLDQIRGRGAHPPPHARWQNPRPLQLKATSQVSAHARHFSRAKPRHKRPQSRKARSSLRAWWGMRTASAIVDGTEQGLDVVPHHLVERCGLGSMAPIDARCGAGLRRRRGSERATSRCRVGEPGLHYPRSLPAPLRRRGGLQRAASTLPSGMGTPGSSMERPRA